MRLYNTLSNAGLCMIPVGLILYFAVGIAAAVAALTLAFVCYALAIEVLARQQSLGPSRHLRPGEGSDLHDWYR